MYTAVYTAIFKILFNILTTNFFSYRDCDRLTVLNHVKAHYRRGEFDGGASQKDSSSQQSTNNKNNVSINRIL